MRSTSPGFQPDRGAGGFQLAETGGFQTQTPVVAGVAGLVVTGGAHVLAITGGSRTVAGEAHVVVTAGACVRWQPAAFFFGAGIRVLSQLWRVQGEAHVVVTAGARVRFIDALAHDDEEILLLLAAASSAGPRSCTDAALLALVREDDALVEAVTGGG